MPSEFDLIARYFSRATPSAILGPGDDCALVAPAAGMELALTTDMLVEGTHFLAGTDPEQLGWKTLAVNLSDLAAMGATPRWILLAGALPEADEDWIGRFAEGFFACAKRYRAEVIGGDTTRGPRNLCVTAMGELPAGTALRRDGAGNNDDIWVSGQPGLAALGLAHLQGRTALPETLARRCIAALQKPLPRVELGLRLRGLATAAIDVSDGLLADLGHILERSGLVADLIEGQLPCIPHGCDPTLARECQLSGGDDYELCFTVPAARRQSVVMLAAELDLPLWRIGHVLADTGRTVGDIRLLDAGEQLTPSRIEALITLAKSTPPPASFLFSHPAHLFACGFGSGLSPWAPGTIGTLFAWASYLVLRPWFDDFGFILLLITGYIFGVLACHKTGKDLGEADHGSIVWDEIVPFWGVLFLCPDNWLWQTTAFFLFRFFDIVKPPPACNFDRIKNGFGVMTDDVFAAAYTVLVLALLKYILG